MRIMTSLAFVFLLSSCANLSVNRNDAPSSDGEKVEVRLASFLEGYVPGKRFPSPSSLCPKGRMESVDFGMESGDVMLTLVTFGIYVPHRAIVTCAK